MMMMNPHLSEMAQVAEAVAVHSPAGNDWVITHLISEPRAICPDAEIREIVEQIHACWLVASKKDNPLGYLVKCVVQAFTPVVLASRRARARAAAEQEEAAIHRAEEVCDTARSRKPGNGKQTDARTPGLRLSVQRHLNGW